MKDIVIQEWLIFRSKHHFEYFTDELKVEFSSQLLNRLNKEGLDIKEVKCLGLDNDKNVDIEIIPNRKVDYINVEFKVSTNDQI